MAGALAYKADGSEAALVFQIKEGSYNTESLIGFLEDLHEHFGAACGCPTASAGAYASERPSAPADGSLERSEVGPRPGRPNSSL